MNIRESTKGLYVYGFVPTNSAADQFRGLGNIHVFDIPYKNATAIVSKKKVVDLMDLGKDSLAKLLIGHQQTIERLMGLGFNTIIPMRLGTFAYEPIDVLKMLDKGYDLIQETFEKINNLLEVDIVASWSDFAQIIGEVALDQRVAEMKKKLELNKNGISQSDQIAIGFVIKNLLDEKKSAYAKMITDSLMPLCKKVIHHEVFDDQMVINTAFLLDKSQSVSIEQTLDHLDEQFGGKLNFKLIGPLPCYSFYTMEKKVLHPDDIKSAKKELGLENSTSEKDIRQAYLNKAKIFHPDANADITGSVSFDNINKAYKTMSDYVSAVKPASREAQFSLGGDDVAENSFFMKIKE